MSTLPTRSWWERWGGLLPWIGMAAAFAWWVLGNLVSPSLAATYARKDEVAAGVASCNARHAQHDTHYAVIQSELDSIKKTLDRIEARLERRTK